jgi:ATP-dependent RNA helicase DeaD
MSNFKSFGLQPSILDAITALGYENPTPIQQSAIPTILTDDTDLIALAQTGTGKTAAFGLPMVHKVNPSKGPVQALILCPTRELCLQITKDLAGFSRFTDGIRTTAVYGGANIREQIKELRSKPQIVVGTPGRTLDLIDRGDLDLSSLKMMVLDEADEMLNMGFQEDLDRILSTSPREKQSLLFSATMPKEVERIAMKYMNSPEKVEVGKRNEGADTVKHTYFVINRRDKFEALSRLCDIHPDMYAVVFCRTRRETGEVAENLMSRGYNADALHGDLSQAQRDVVMGRFRKKKLQILVATDVAARGLDVDQLTHVINYSLPDDPEVYVHRSGRTGRAGNTGHSYAICEPRDVSRIRRIEKMMKKKFEKGVVPAGRDVVEVQLVHRATKLGEAEIEYGKITPYLASLHEIFEHYSKEDIIEKWAMNEMSHFMTQYEKSGDINANEKSDRGSKSKRDRGERGGRRERRGGSEEGFQTFEFSMGRREGMSPALVMGIINENTRNDKIGIGRIDIHDNRTYVDIDQDHSDKLQTAFRKAKYKGTPVDVMPVSSAPPRKRRDRRDGGGGGRFSGKPKGRGGASGSGRRRTTRK